ncbi:MAG: shikimate dehydrogenase [Acidobacteria bacterium]|nr:MAG: shikimate dehydrogenase [Acidobacteriota bacterium]
MTKICVPVCVDRIDKMREAVERASQVADIVELRLDYLSESELAQSNEIRAVVRFTKRPVILTLRPAEYGGHRAMNTQDRLFFRIQNLSVVREKSPRNYWDLELDLALILEQREKEGNDVAGWGSVDWKHTICSHHDFVGIPRDLDGLYKAMAATPAAIIKIAVQADDAIDCLPIFRLLEHAQRERRELIAIAMGQAGIMTRVLGPSRGSFLTYASIDEDNKTAPGQLTAKELRELYRVDQIGRETQIFGIIGNPVSHSLSPRIHNASFAASDLNAVYIPMQVDDARPFMLRMAHPKSRELDWNLRGLSVTAPHKSTVMSFLDWIDPSAKEIGAVNTIVVRDDQLLGYNTDAAGFISPLRERFGSLNGVRCAVIGAGGAARAVLWALRNADANVALFVRDVEKATALSNQYDLSCDQLENARFESFDIVINAAPLGTRGEHEDRTAARAEQLRGVRLAYDLVYNPPETRFLREAREAGCETLSGVEMLLYQAVEQFKLWTGSEPDRPTIREAAMRALTQPSGN